MSSQESRYSTQAMRLFVLAPRIREVGPLIFYTLYDLIATILNTQSYRIFSIGSAFYDLIGEYDQERLDMRRPRWYLPRADPLYDLPTLSWVLLSMSFDQYCDAEIVAYHLLRNSPLEVSELIQYFAIHGRVPPSSPTISVQLIELNSWADLMPNVNVHGKYYPNLMLNCRYA
ncbi:hypothetical protein H0H93_004896 [Arthromyces matolae]|nr:hypothetical protein H0H93_004896 [Arthromyces matolae]